MDEVTSLRTVKLGGKDCDYKGEKICNGAVTKEIGTKLVKVCSDGKIKTKSRKIVGEGFPLVGRDTGAGKGDLEVFYNVDKSHIVEVEVDSTFLLLRFSLVFQLL